MLHFTGNHFKWFGNTETKAEGTEERLLQSLLCLLGCVSLPLHSIFLLLFIHKLFVAPELQHDLALVYHVFSSASHSAMTLHFRTVNTSNCLATCCSGPMIETRTTFVATQD